MITTREATLALYGAYRLARVDPKGLFYFDATIEGFWRSFYAALLVAPAYVILLALDLGDRPATAGPVKLVLVEGIVYVIGWTAFPLAMVYVARWLGRSQHYICYIVAQNWANVLEIALFFSVVAIAVGSAAVAVLPLLLAGIAVLVYEWYIARTALEITGWQAAAVVALSVILDFIITYISSGMLRDPAG